jgi:hypothetical protein
MTKKGADDGVDDFGALRAIGDDATGARRVARVLDALAEVSLRYDARAIGEPPKRRDRLAFVAELARVLHQLVLEAAGGEPHTVMVAVSRVERLTLWVRGREMPADDVDPGPRAREEGLRLCEVLVARLLPAVWDGAPGPAEYR